MFLHKKIHVIFISSLAFILGIVWGSYYSNLYALILPLSIALLFIIAASVKAKKYIKTVLLVSCTFFAGVLNLTYQVHSHTNFLYKVDGKKFNIVATVRDIRKLKNKACPFYVLMSASKIKNTQLNNWKDIDKYICVYTRKKPNVKMGDIIKAKNITIKKPKNKSYSNYLIKENIAATAFANNLDYNILHRPKYSITRWLYHKKENILNSLEKKMSPKLFATFSSVFLGNKNISKKEKGVLKNKFKAWGILHILARSGLHLIIFLLICEFLLIFAPIYFYIKQLLIIILSIIYLLLSWPSISFIRAFSVLLLYKICPFLNRKPDLVYIVTTLCVTMLIKNPIQLFFLDFQLSFLLTLTLAIYNRTQARLRRKQISQNNRVKKSPLDK